MQNQDLQHKPCSGLQFRRKCPLHILKLCHTEVAAASRAKLRLALTETDTDRQKQFLEEAVCGSYYEKFACMCGMLYLADRWETQGIDGLQSAFADYHGFAQRALSIRI